MPYRGSSGARTDVIGGQVEMMFDAVTSMAEHVKSGRVSALATTGTERSTVLPDVPTMAQAGLAGYETTIWLGLMAPKDTPRAIVQKLNAQVVAITQHADVRAAWAKAGAVPLAMSSDQFGRYIQDDISKWAKIVKYSGAKAD